MAAPPFFVPTKKIPELTDYGAPFSGSELLEIWAVGTSRRVTARDFCLPAVDPILMTVNMASTHPQSRYLVAGPGITVTDNGPGSTFEIAATGTAVFVNTTDSIQGGGQLTSDLFLNLVGDVPVPGNLMLYGTNASGVRGWYTQASLAPLIDHGVLVGLADDDHPQYLNTVRGDIRYYTKALADATFLTPVSGDALFLTPAEGDARYALISSVITDHGLLTGLADDDHTQYHNNARGDARYPPLARTITGTNSVTGGGDLSGNRTLQLSGDVASPGNTMLYGTNASGVKGWYAQPVTTVTPSALTTANDTNITLTASGSPTVALLAATLLTVAWAGTLSVSRGGTGATTLTGYVKGNGTSAFTASATIPYTDITGGPPAVTPAALTKADDTNVTLTLGGTPTTALLQATSITAGWTGQLSVSRGGTGAATLAAGYVRGNATSPLTTVSTIPYSDLTGTPTIPTAANPTGSVALTANNGAAATFMRSDAAPALDVTIAPTWSGRHTFSNGVTNYTGNQVELRWKESDATANNGHWRIMANAEQFSMAALDDAVTASTSWVTVDRTLQVIDQVNFAGTVVSVNGQDVRNTALFTAGTLGVARGGTGAATLTGYVKGNGTSAFTASATIPYSDLTGTPTIPSVTPSALTKTDDTNVTLTLGGTPATALLQATSITAGWTGQLSVARGGTGAATLTGYVKGAGTSAMTASATIPYSDLTGTPTIPGPNNPATNIGLTAVNGTAGTYMRSDAAPALSQAIVPTWTGIHTFSGGSGAAGTALDVVVARSGQAGIAISQSNQTADNKVFDIFVSGLHLQMRAINDLNTVATAFFDVVRSTTTISSLDLTATSIGLNGKTDVASGFGSASSNVDFIVQRGTCAAGVGNASSIQLNCSGTNDGVILQGGSTTGFQVFTNAAGAGWVSQMTIAGTTVNIANNLSIGAGMVCTSTATFNGQISAVGNIILDNTSPVIRFNQSGAGADAKRWEFLVSTTFRFRTRTDADGTGADIFQVTRSGTAVSKIAFSTTVEATTFNATSSRDIKRETGRVNKACDVLARLRPVLYRLLDHVGGSHDEQLGLIAEEVHAICPQLSPDGTTVAYDRLALLLLADWQERYAA